MRYSFHLSRRLKYVSIIYYVPSSKETNLMHLWRSWGACCESQFVIDVKDSNQHQAEGSTRKKFTFALRQSCLLLFCAKVVIAATIPHVGFYNGNKHISVGTKEQTLSMENEKEYGKNSLICITIFSCCPTSSMLIFEPLSNKSQNVMMNHKP